jgi:hypothetical protein
MNSKKKYIFFLLAKLPLLVVYISFFTVQLFYNFDIASHPGNIITSASFQKNEVLKNNHAVAKKAAFPSEKKENFRLNKRYQPRTVVCCDAFVLKPVTCFVFSKQHVHYSTGFIPFSIPRAHSLRGPPFGV